VQQGIAPRASCLARYPARHGMPAACHPVRRDIPPAKVSGPMMRTVLCGYTDLAGFTLRCGVCQQGLRGQQVVGTRNMQINYGATHRCNM
jgi:hypothetical protein